MNYYFDTEFLDDGKTIDLISIGIVAEDGREYYAVSANFDESRATPWLHKHVLNHIPRDFRRTPRGILAMEVSAFLEPGEKNRVWGWYPAYDWVALCQLYGPMIARPPHFPKRPLDLRQELDRDPSFIRPKQYGTKHNALEDAKWVKACHEAWIDALRVKGPWGETQQFPSYVPTSLEAGYENPLTHVPRGAKGL